MTAPSYAAAARSGKANAAAPLLRDKCAPRAIPSSVTGTLRSHLHVLASPAEENAATRVIVVSSLAPSAAHLPSAPSEG
jgi:hypothetical protein